MKASVILQQAAELIQDEDADTWTQKQGIRWLNEAQNTIVNIDPSANAVIENFTLVSGTKQVLESDQIRVIRLVRNMGTDGSTPGTVINGPIDRDTFSDFLPTWHTQAEQEAITDYIYDEDSDPKSFWTYPPSDGTGLVEGIFQKTPVDITHPDDDINLNDEHSPAMLDYVMWRYHSRDSLEASRAKAQEYLTAFANRLGVQNETAAEAAK